MGAINVANAITITELRDASVDAQALEAFVNADAATQVPRRLAPAVKTLSYYAAYMDTLSKGKDGAKGEDGARGADGAKGEKGVDGSFTQKAYDTYAAMVADKAAIPANTSVNITNDTDMSKNGLYAYNGTAFTKSAYDPLSLAKAFTIKQTDTALSDDISPSQLMGARIAGNIEAERINILSGYKNWTLGVYVGLSGEIVSNPPTKITGYIAVGLGDEIEISSPVTYSLATYDANLNWTATIQTDDQYPHRYKIVNENVAFVRVCMKIVATGTLYLHARSKTLPWLFNNPSNIYAAVREILPSALPVQSANLLDGVVLNTGFYLDDAGLPQAFANYSYSDYVAVSPDKSYSISVASYFVGIFYDDAKNVIGAIPAPPKETVNNYKFTAPFGAAFVRVNLLNADPAKSLRANPYSLAIASNLLSAWYGKKIAWYGTSIPAGYPHQDNQDVYSHANLAVHDLGGTIINKCVPSGGVSLTTTLSFARLTDTINYKNDLIDIIGTAQNPDLVVFDYGVNDYDQSKADIDAFDPLDPFDTAATGTKTKIDTRNTSTFIGAYNMIIDAMLTKNPSIKFCFITHFSDDSANTSIAQKAEFFTKMNIVIEALADYWAVPVLRLHTKTNYRNRNGFNSISPAMPDNIHPASGSGEAVESLRNIVRDFLISIA